MIAYLSKLQMRNHFLQASYFVTFLAFEDPILLSQFVPFRMTFFDFTLTYSRAKLCGYLPVQIRFLNLCHRLLEQSQSSFIKAIAGARAFDLSEH